MKRIISLVVSLLLAASAMLLAPTTASAEPAIGASVSDTASVAAKQSSKPARPIVFKFKQVGKSQAKLFGKAKNFKKKKIILQKKNGKNWSKDKKQKTKKNGKFAFTVVVPRDGKKHIWRVLAKGDKKYSKSVSQPIALYYR